MKKLTALLLAFVLLLGLAPATLAAGPSNAAIVEAALEFLYAHEGNYGSVNKNDNGALSVGKIQWHADRALSLVRSVVNSDPDQAKSILGDELYEEILSVKSWASRTVDEEEAAALSSLLTTSAGKAAQDALATSDISGYIKRGKNLGLTDAAALVYFADLENQGGYGMSKRVATSAANAAGSFGAVTLSRLHLAALNDVVAGNYPVRRKQAYTYCQGLGWASVTTVSFPKVNTYKQGQFSDVSASQWYAKSVASAVTYGLMQGDTEGTFRPTGQVTLAEAITMAARIHCIYATGKQSFTQTADGPWYQVYLDYAYKQGIIDASTYKGTVTKAATRAQFAAIFAKALPDDALAAKNTVKDNAIPDVSTKQSYAAAVYKLYRAGILTGDENHRFQPQSNITRAEVAAVAARMADSSSRVSITL